MSAGIDITQAPPAAAQAPAARKTYPPLSLCLGFGVGTAGVSIVLNSISVYFPALMATVLGVSPALAGTLVMLSKIYDGFADIGIGAASDRTHSRLGRRRPWMLAGAVVSCLALLMIFVVPLPGGGSGGGPLLIGYMAVALVIYSTGYSMFNVPYLALPADISRNTAQRLRLISFRTAFVGVGQMTALALSAWLIKQGGGGTYGYRLMGAVMAALALATMLASFFGTSGAQESAAPLVRHRLDWAELRSVGRNRPLVLLLGAKLTQYIAFGIFMPANLLFLLNVLKLGYGGMIDLALGQNAAIFISMPIWTRIARLIGKRNAYMLAVCLMIPVALSWWWTDAHIAIASVWWRACVFGAGSGGAMLMSTSMLQDTMEFDRLRTGRRREGVLASLYSVNEKLGFAIGAALLGYGLAFGGYRATTGGHIVQQAAGAMRALYLIETLVPAAVLATGLMLIFCYRLGEAELDATAGRERAA